MELDRVLQALRNADAAGDVAAARRLAQIARRISGLPPTPTPEPLPQGEPGAYASFMRGARGIGSLITDVVPAMAGKALGFEDYARRQMQEAAEYGAETQRLYPAEVPSFTGIKDVGTALTYVKEAIFEALPSLIPSIVTGGGAGVLSTGAQVAAREAAERAAVSLATQRLVQTGGQAALTAAAVEGIKKEAVEAGLKAAQRVALTYQATGAVVGSGALTIPEAYQGLAEKAPKGTLPDLGPALVSGSFNAFLDAIVPLNILRKARAAGVPDSALIGAWYKRAGKRAGKGAVEGFLTEGATEAVQEMSNAVAEQFVNENSRFFSPENFVRFIDAGLKGGFGGAGITAAANVAFGRKEEAAPAPEEAPPDTTPAPPTTSGEQDVAGPESGTGRKRFEILEQPVGGAPTAGAGAPELGGVAGAGQAAGTASVGEGQQPPTVTPTVTPTAATTPAATTPAQKDPRVARLEELGEAKKTRELTPDESEEFRSLASYYAIDDLDSLDLNTLPESSPLRKTATATTPAPTTSPEILKEIATDEARIGAEYEKERKTYQDDENTEALFNATKEGRLPEEQPIGSRRLNEVLRKNGIPPELYELPADFDSLPQEQKDEFVKELIQDIYEELTQARSARAEIPAWDRLNRDAKDVYLANMTENTPEERAKAREALRTYLNRLSDVQGKSRTKVTSSPEAQVYELNREKYNKLEGMTFPGWNDLPENLRELFTRALKKYAPKERIHRSNTFQHDFAFKSLANAVKEQADNLRAQQAAQPTTSAAYEIAQKEIAAKEEEKRKTPPRTRAEGKGRPRDELSPTALELLQKGNLQALLEYLGVNATGGGLSSTRRVFRAVAKRIAKLKLNTRISVVLPEEIKTGGLAEYDPKTDTIRIAATGATESNLLHELVHASTVKILRQYLSKDRSVLTQAQQDSVAQILDVMKLAEKSLGKKYSSAFKDPYEFVAYAMTDFPFQRELAALDASGLEYSVIPEANPSLWSELLTSFVNLFDAIIKPFVARLQKAFKREEGGKKAPATTAPVQEEWTNALLEAVSAFEQIMAVPDGGINMEPMATQGTAAAPTSAPTTTQAPTGLPTLTKEEFEAEILRQLEIKERGTKAFLKGLATESGQDWAIRKFQNERNVIKQVFERAQKFGLIKRTTDELNDVWGQITRSTGMAVDLYSKFIEPRRNEAEVALEKYAEKRNISVKEALSRLHAILEARHEPERRHVKFLLSVPLEKQKEFTVTGFNDSKGKPLSYSAEGWREHILKELTRADLAPNEKAREKLIEDYRNLLEDLVADTRTHVTVVEGVDSKGRKTTNPVSPDQYKDSHENYNVIAGRIPTEIKRMKDVFDTEEDSKEIEAIIKPLRKIQEETKRLNKESNYWSAPVQNIVDFYAFENYVPFKGKAGRTSLSDQLEYDSKRIGGELQDFQAAMGGRLSESENPVLQIIAEGAQAAMRAGRKELTLAIKNAIKDKIISGKVAGKIPFQDRYLRGETKKELGGPDKIFHYTADGTIEVLKLENQAELEAIRRSYRESSPFWDKVNMITSGIGQTHTRFNPAFAPMNFVRDSLTNAFTLGAELSPAVAGRLIKEIAAEVASGGLFRSAKFASLYSAGKFSEIERLAGGTAPYNTLNSKQRYYRDLNEYVKSGGKVSYLQGIAAKGALDSLVKEVGRPKVLRTIDQIARFFDIYNEAFELAARVGAYRVMRQEFRAAGESATESEARSIEYAKNLANFEQVGEWGKQAGALFMFFRPAATGAVRAIDALKPAFGFNVDDFRAAAQAKGRTPEQIKRAVAEMKQQQKYARVMVGSLLGLGVAMYYIAMMMSGDDDQGRNRVATDDMARWTRYARIFVPGMENALQIPWGFGLGAFAAAGAQIASLTSNRASFADIAANIATIGLDSFLPIPFSRISPVENFPAFALDSITPSAARPFFEYVMNLDGLGREIYNNRQSRYGDAYTGGDNIPEVYKDVAKWMVKETEAGVNVSPNTLYFFANNFADGFAKIGTWAYNIGLTLSGQKDFDPKNDSLLLASFIGTKSNIDSREFNKAETYIKNLGTRINTLKNQGMLAQYARKNPEDLALYQMYNQAVNGALRDLRYEAGRIRASDLSPKERKAKLDQIIRMQNIVKRQILDAFEASTGYKP